MTRAAQLPDRPSALIPILMPLYRTDVGAAEAYLRDLMPNQRHRRHAAALFAGSIRVANNREPSAWEVTGRKGLVRLNVGQISVLEIFHDAVCLYTVDGPDPEAPGVSQLEHEYDAVPVEAQRWEVFHDALPTIATALLRRHEDLIDVAARAKRRSPFAKFHSPAVVSAIAKLARTVLPQPAYYAPTSLAQAEDCGMTGRDAPLFGDYEQNALTEQRAVTIAAERLRAEGWHVRSVEADHCGYDLHCVQGSAERHVEVKGRRGPSDQFVITAAELKRARSDPEFELFVVSALDGVVPSIERWAHGAIERAFRFEPLQFIARREA